jgi:hypothetical protein
MSNGIHELINRNNQEVFGKGEPQAQVRSAGFPPVTQL